MIEAFTSNPVLSGVIAMVVFAAIYFLVRKIKGQSPGLLKRKQAQTVSPVPTPVDSLPKGEGVLARVYDCKYRKIQNETIPLEQVEEIQGRVGNLGRKWLYMGDYVYALERKVDGEMGPLPVTRTMDDHPSALHRDLHHPQVAVCYDMTEQISFLEQYWPYLAFGGVCIFLLWTLVAPR